MIATKTILIAAAVGLAGALSGGAFLGYRYADGQCAKRVLKALEKADERAEQAATEGAARLAAAEQEAQRYAQRIEAYIRDHPDNRDCLDADELRLWNEPALPATAGD